MARSVECIPNFSCSRERDERAYSALVETAKGVPGCALLDAQSDGSSAERRGEVQGLTKQQKAERIAKLEKEMREAAKMLEFELAAALRDQIIELRGK